ncbi:Sulfotransferase domain [Micractinium conductrix]|uniref:Sulfotransferase domain n=1 Tax=Micractinium conductrix TaxID=554055 RepID=A0A2P6VBQ0_9CHLO|nr:Sulfotransferase domain [Micractinium conductrix]|eukprot:PSC71515.1 Sulfotransferase domain [Micractinium conductrix]
MAEALARFPAGLPGILRASNPVAQECFYGNPRYGGFRCPQPEVPCNASGAPLLALDSSNSSCFMHLPQPSRGALGVVHFLRNPWDIVVSAYWYHSQKKAPEGWLNGKWEDFFRLMGKTGVPLQRLADLGLGAVQQHAGQSYAEVLRALPDEQGVQLEFWRSAPAMYAMARQYGILQHHPDAQQVQFEQMMASFEATWRGILQRYYPQVLERVMKGVQECDPGSWDQEKVAVSAHVTSSKHPPEAKDRLLRVLATQPDIRRHLCELTPAVGYPNPEGLCESSTD